MEKYSQQESIIQNLKQENEELLIALENYEGEQMERQSMASSVCTEMVLASDGTMSAGGYSSQMRAVRPVSTLLQINEEKSESAES